MRGYVGGDLVASINGPGVFMGGKPKIGERAIWNLDGRECNSVPAHRFCRLLQLLHVFGARRQADQEESEPESFHKMCFMAEHLRSGQGGASASGNEQSGNPALAWSALVSRVHLLGAAVVMKSFPSFSPTGKVTFRFPPEYEWADFNLFRNREIRAVGELRLAQEVSLVGGPF